MFRFIIFRERHTNQPSKCFMVGVMGCKSIVENNLGEKEGIEVRDYTVSFDDRTTLKVCDTILVSA